MNSVIDAGGFVTECTARIAEMLTDIHRQGTGAATEANTLGAELSGVALFTPQGSDIVLYV